MHEQAKVLKKKGFRQLPAKKKRKLLRFSRLEILHGRQSGWFLSAIIELFSGSTHVHKRLQKPKPGSRHTSGTPSG